MISRPFKFTLLLLALVVGGGVLVLVHLDNRRLRLRLEDRRQDRAQTEAFKIENTRLQEWVASRARGASDAEATMRTQLQQAQVEIAALEKRAAERSAEKAAQAAREAAMLKTNRDPQLGPVRVENFENSGQASPTAAFKTLVWAAVKADDAENARLCAASKATRARAEALIARLPESARAKWTPEKLAALVVTGALTEAPALQITGEHYEDAPNAIVTFRIIGREGEEKVKLKLSPVGWHVALSSGALERMEKKMGLKPRAEPSK
jgi:hypothetical protein